MLRGLPMEMTATGKIHRLSLREQLKDYQLPESVERRR